MNPSVYKDSTILNRVLEFPVTLAWTERHILRTFWTAISCKNDAMPSSVNNTRLYVIGDVMKI